MRLPRLDNAGSFWLGQTRTEHHMAACFDGVIFALVTAQGEILRLRQEIDLGDERSWAVDDAEMGVAWILQRLRASEPGNDRAVREGADRFTPGGA